MWPFTKKPTQAAHLERSNPTRIAVLEHDLLGIKPEPGTVAALTIALRYTGTCLEHEPVETTSLQDPRPTATCTRCGRQLLENDEGAWVTAGTHTRT